MLLACAVAAVVIIRIILRKANESTRKWTVIAICGLNIIAFFIYKAALSADTEFLDAAGITQFNWFNELPIQLCNINMFLIPIGLITGKRGLLGFSFFVAPLGALMAVFFPEPAFTGFPLTIPRIMGFYGTHLLILVCALSLATLGLYRPRLKDFPQILITFIILSVVMHGVNLILRATVCPFANYFFTFHADISILNLFWSWIPVPLLYLLPGLAILLAYMGLVSLFFVIPDAIRKKS